MYGNSKRTTRMPRSDNPRATLAMNGVRIGPPAPWAKAKVEVLSGGPSINSSIRGRIQFPNAASTIVHRRADAASLRRRLTEAGSEAHVQTGAQTGIALAAAATAESDCARCDDSPHRHVSRQSVAKRQESCDVQGFRRGEALLLR